jgi:hypothetical protein
MQAGRSFKTQSGSGTASRLDDAPVARLRSAPTTTVELRGVFNSFSDGFNPVIFDADGSITDAIFGAGAKSSILGEGDVDRVFSVVPIF